MDKLEIIQKKIDKKHTDVFWYDGNIANIGDYYLRASGSIKVMFKEGGEWYQNGQALDIVWDKKLTDKKLERLYNNGMFDMNNWFEVVHYEKECVEGVMGDVAYDYDEGIELLQKYHKEKIFKY